MTGKRLHVRVSKYKSWKYERSLQLTSRPRYDKPKRALSREDTKISLMASRAVDILRTFITVAAWSGLRRGSASHIKHCESESDMIALDSRSCKIWPSSGLWPVSFKNDSIHFHTTLAISVLQFPSLNCSIAPLISLAKQFSSNAPIAPLAKPCL